MCPPDHYEVAYAINPWMHPDDWRPHASDLAAESRREWLALRAVFEELEHGHFVISATAKDLKAEKDIVVTQRNRSDE